MSSARPSARAATLIAATSKYSKPWPAPSRPAHPAIYAAAAQHSTSACSPRPSDGGTRPLRRSVGSAATTAMVAGTTDNQATAPPALCKPPSASRCSGSPSSIVAIAAAIDNIARRCSSRSQTKTSPASSPAAGVAARVGAIAFHGGRRSIAQPPSMRRSTSRAAQNRSSSVAVRATACSSTPSGASNAKITNIAA